MPILVTRINIGEDNLAFIKINFRRHRWYTNLLKSNDPIIVSSGWRRYQTMITFATEDQNERLRFLKYTPHHDFCTGVFYGNFNQQNSGCIFTQTIRDDIKKFRIAGSGLIMEINKSFEVIIFSNSDHEKNQTDWRTLQNHEEHRVRERNVQLINLSGKLSRSSNQDGLGDQRANQEKFKIRR